MKQHVQITIFLFVLLVSQPVSAIDPEEEIAPGVGWHEAGVTLLDVDFDHTGFHSRWEYFRCECGDILVRMEQSSPEGVLTGEMVLVGGKVLAARGMVTQAGDLEMMLQAPTLMVQLGFGLLQRSIPGGPADVTMDMDIDVEEEIVDVELNTGLSTGRFGAPWKLKGRAWRSGPSKRSFKMDFVFTSPMEGRENDKAKIGFTGAQQFGSEVYPLHEETPLEGWSIQWISRGEITSAPAPEGLTLGKLREEAETQAQNQPSS